MMGYETEIIERMLHIAYTPKDFVKNLDFFMMTDTIAKLRFDHEKFFDLILTQALSRMTARDFEVNDGFYFFIMYWLSKMHAVK